MLTEISVKNLGCFGDQAQRVTFSEETLMAGPNNSGKSMLMAAFNLVRNWLITGGLNFDTEYYALHDFEAAVNSHVPTKAIEISFILKDMQTRIEFEFRFAREGLQKTRASINNQVMSHPRDSRVTDALKRVWYLRPNRSLVSYQTSVQHTEDLLQPLRPSGSNVINYLLERWTARDRNWSQAESWLRKIDPDMSQLKTPIRGNSVSLETLFGDTDINVSLQGSGFQSAASIISAVTFSPEGSIIIIEEPEAFLHPKSQEIVVDMINEAVNNHNKQVIFSTHSFNILLPIWHDLGQPKHKRDEGHVPTDPKKFSMWTFEKSAGEVTIKPYNLSEKTWKNFSEDFKILWGN